MFKPRRQGMFSLTWLCLGFVLITVTWVSAQSGSGEEQQQQKPKTAPIAKRPAESPLANVAMTPERQAAALKFAELHHPELYQLLHGLKQAHRKEYQKAVRQLYADSERLARYKERTPSRHQLALTEWQLDSRLRLLVARMTMSSEDPELNTQLQTLLKKRLETRLSLLKLDRERQAARLSRLDEQIESIETDSETAIQKDLQRIKRSLGLNQRPVKRPPQN